MVSEYLGYELWQAFHVVMKLQYYSPTWFPRALKETSRCLLYDELIPELALIIRDVFPA